MTTSKVKSKKTPLSNGLKSYISGELVKPQDILIDAKRSEIINILYILYRPIIPQTLIDAMESAKGTVFQLKTLQITVDAYGFGVTGLPAMNENAYSAFNKEYDKIINFWRESAQASKLLLLVNELKALYAGRNSISNQISCVLSNIRTEEDLASEFPEAYTVYMELKKKDNPNKQSVGCDNIENLRATLSKVRSTASKIGVESKETKTKSHNKK